MKANLSGVGMHQFVAAGCAGKFGFASWRQAKEVADREREKAEPYRCKFCKKYHLGHPKKKARQQRVAELTAAEQYDYEGRN